MAFGGRRWQRCALGALLPALLLAGQACSPAVDQAHSLHTRVGSVPGISSSDVTAATPDRSGTVEIVLDRGLDADETLAVVEKVVAAADHSGFRDYVLEVRRSLVEQDVLVVDESFADLPRGRAAVESWIRSVDALLGEVTYAVQAGGEDVEVVSGGGIGHDVAEVSRIGHGGATTTWRFVNDTTTFVVSGSVRPRDVALFDRVQRTVASTVLPVPATRWELQRRRGHLVLDLDVRAAGNPAALTVATWGRDLEPLARAAERATRYPGLARWLQVSDVAGLRGTTPAPRDTFATWSSEGAPTQGRDRLLRGWDRWWFTLTRR